jgi:hypothetical protein
MGVNTNIYERNIILIQLFYSQLPPNTPECVLNFAICDLIFTDQVRVTTYFVCELIIYLIYLV